MQSVKRFFSRYAKRVGFWFKKHYRLVGIISGALVLVVVLVQIFYPSDRALPFAQIDGQSIAFQSKNDVTKKLTALANAAKVHVKIEDYTQAELVTAIGGDFDKEKTVQATLSYPTWQRYVPFSIFFVRSGELTLHYTFKDEDVKAYAAKTEQAVYKAPVNATLTIANEKITVNEEKAGAKLNVDEFIKKLKQADIHGKDSTSVSMKRDSVKPARDKNAIDGTRKQAEEALAKTITIHALTKNHVVSVAELAKWLTFSEGENNAYSLTLNDEAIAGYLNTIATEVYVAPGVTKVSVVDGVEVSRVKGSDGRGLDAAQVKTSVQEVIFKNASTTIEAQVSAIAPKEDVTRQFSATERGLQAYINDLAARKSMNIVVRQLSGAGWSVSAKGGDTVVAASTYKLFVSLALFDEIKANKFKWEDPMLDTNIATCFDRMIVKSDNACAEKFVSMIGRGRIDAILAGHGFSGSTKFSANTWALMSSANDLNKLLMGLNSGSIFSVDDRNRLLTAMNKQVYRQGVPAGSSGSVADKVGFLNEILNDAAIVTTPRGTYAISIMTRNSSWGEIAQITKTIEGLMYP